MTRHAHNLRMCFDPEYPEKFSRFKDCREEIRGNWVNYCMKLYPGVIALVNVPAGITRSPIILLYGVLGWPVLAALLCQVRVAALRRSMLS